MTELEDVVSREAVDYWTYAVVSAGDMTVTNNVGIETVWIFENTLDDDSIKYTVEIETSSEISNWNKGAEEVLDNLIFNAVHEFGDFETDKIFDDEESALEYAENTYKKADLILAVRSHYEDGSDIKWSSDERGVAVTCVNCGVTQKITTDYPASIKKALENGDNPFKEKWEDGAGKVLSCNCY